MQVVDGSRGGGQLIRAAVAFAALDGTAVRVNDARSGRDPPGLKAQHVAAITAVADLCDAETDGVAVGETSFEFDPGQPSGGTYEVDIGTAGSCTLVFDAILPVVATFDEPVSLAVTGGTDVKWAPTVDYYRHVKLPVLRALGLDVTLSVETRGFYPAGGGQATLNTDPGSVSAPELTARGELHSFEVHSTASTSLADAEVADRQSRTAIQHLPDEFPLAESIAYCDSQSPGSVLDLVAVFEETRMGFSVLGERGKPAEEVATDAVAELAAARVGAGVVDRYLADQLVPFVALAGGTVHAPMVTGHLETHVDLLQQFGYDVVLDRQDRGVLIQGR